jgi:hypothetical protein
MPRLAPAEGGSRILRLLSARFCRIGRDQAPSLGDVVAAVDLETPRVEHHGQIVGVEIVAGEIEIDQA